MKLSSRTNDALLATTSGVPMHVIAVIVLSIGLLVVNASLLIINAAATMESHAEYARAYEIKRALNTFQSVLTAAESGQRGYLLTGQTGYLEPYYRAMRGWRNEIERLRSLTSDNPERQRDIAEVGEGDRRGDSAPRADDRTQSAAGSERRHGCRELRPRGAHHGSRARHRRAHDGGGGCAR